MGNLAEDSVSGLLSAKNVALASNAQLWKELGELQRSHHQSITEEHRRLWLAAWESRLRGSLIADRQRREELVSGLVAVLAGLRSQLAEQPHVVEALDKAVYGGLAFLGCCNFQMGEQGSLPLEVPFRYELCRFLGQCLCPDCSSGGTLTAYTQLNAAHAA